MPTTGTLYTPEEHLLPLGFSRKITKRSRTELELQCSALFIPIFIENSKQPSPLMTTRPQRKKDLRTSFDELVNSATESLPKVEDVTDVTPPGSSGLQPEAKSAFQEGKVAMRE